MRGQVPARFERTVASVAGLAVAACGAWVAPQLRAMLLVLGWPFVTCALAAGIAASPTPRLRAALVTATWIAMIATTAVWSLIGAVLIVPALVPLGLGLAWKAFVFRAGGDERAARAVLATGAYWTPVFAISVWLGSPPALIHVVLAGTIAITVAGLAWWRAIVRARGEGAELARALLIRSACR